MIRDAVIHLLNEQPVVADLFAAPEPGDVTLLCTNLRTLDGRRPIFVDSSDSTFVFPYLHIRFLEIRQEGRDRRDETAVAGDAARQSDAPSDEDLEISEDFLRRIREA